MKMYRLTVPAVHTQYLYEREIELWFTANELETATTIKDKFLDRGYQVSLILATYVPQRRKGQKVRPQVA